jgi:hypothetical protein
MSSPYNGNPEYALNVYGSGDSQTAAPGQGNLIKMHNMSGGNGSGVHPVVGGRRRGKSGRRGGTGLGTMLVPAGLVLADNYTYNKLRGKKQSFKRGRGRKSVSRYFGGNEGYIEPKVGGSDSGLASMIPGVNMGGNAPVIPGVNMGGNAPVVSQKGGAFPPPKYNLGGSTLVDLAIPAGFVYANDKYYNRKNRTTGRRRRTSRRTRGRRRR